jgi:hypothetical protein
MVACEANGGWIRRGSSQIDVIYDGPKTTKSRSHDVSLRKTIEAISRSCRRPGKINGPFLASDGHILLEGLNEYRRTARPFRGQVESRPVIFNVIEKSSNPYHCPQFD